MKTEVPARRRYQGTIEFRNIHLSNVPSEALPAAVIATLTYTRERGQSRCTLSLHSTSLFFLLLIRPMYEYVHASISSHFYVPRPRRPL
jgi:hypothetical protein